MEVNSYKWARYKNGKGYAAIVVIDVLQNTNAQNEIVEHYKGRGFTSQGYIEEVPENGYEAWKIGARRGLEYAFSLFNTKWIVHINKIQGRHSIDTNATIVGYTILRAFLEKINFGLTSEQIEELESFVFNSWENYDVNVLPNFFDRTFETHQ